MNVDRKEELKRWVQERRAITQLRELDRLEKADAHEDY